MVSKRDTILGIFYYLGGLAVTLASPELEIPQRFVVFSLFALVVFVIESVRRVLRKRREDVISREPQVEALLNGLIRKHQEKSDCHLRANVMVPFENRPIQSQLFRQRSHRTLKFKNYAGEYSEQELQLSYEFGQGSCGLAWKRCRPVIYGEGRKEAPEEKMTEVQLEKAGNVESILSVPIYDGERRSENLICVVNIDSEDRLSETCFTEDDVKSLTERHADVVAATVEEDYHA